MSHAEYPSIINIKSSLMCVCVSTSLIINSNLQWLQIYRYFWYDAKRVKSGSMYLRRLMGETVNVSAKYSNLVT